MSTHHFTEVKQQWATWMSALFKILTALQLALVDKKPFLALLF